MFVYEEEERGTCRRCHLESEVWQRSSLPLLSGPLFERLEYLAFAPKLDKQSAKGIRVARRAQTRDPTERRPNQANRGVA